MNFLIVLTALWAFGHVISAQYVFLTCPAAVCFPSNDPRDAAIGTQLATLLTKPSDSQLACCVNGTCSVDLTVTCALTHLISQVVNTTSDMKSTTLTPSQESTVVNCSSNPTLQICKELSLLQQSLSDVWKRLNASILDRDRLMTIPQFSVAGSSNDVLHQVMSWACDARNIPFCQLASITQRMLTRLAEAIHTIPTMTNMSSIRSDIKANADSLQLLSASSAAADTLLKTTVRNSVKLEGRVQLLEDKAVQQTVSNTTSTTSRTGTTVSELDPAIIPVINEFFRMPPTIEATAETTVSPTSSTTTPKTRQKRSADGSATLPLSGDVTTTLGVDGPSRAHDYYSPEVVHRVHGPNGQKSFRNVYDLHEASLPRNLHIQVETVVRYPAGAIITMLVIMIVIAIGTVISWMFGYDKFKSYKHKIRIKLAAIGTIQNAIQSFRKTCRVDSGTQICLGTFTQITTARTTPCLEIVGHYAVLARNMFTSGGKGYRYISKDAIIGMVDVSLGYYIKAGPVSSKILADQFLKLSVQPDGPAVTWNTWFEHHPNVRGTGNNSTFFDDVAKVYSLYRVLQAVIKAATFGNPERYNDACKSLHFFMPTIQQYYETPLGQFKSLKLISVHLSDGQDNLGELLIPRTGLDSANLAGTVVENVLAETKTSDHPRGCACEHCEGSRLAAMTAPLFSANLGLATAPDPEAIYASPNQRPRHDIPNPARTGVVSTMAGDAGVIQDIAKTLANQTGLVPVPATYQSVTP